MESLIEKIDIERYLIKIRQVDPSMKSPFSDGPHPFAACSLLVGLELAEYNSSGSMLTY